MRRVLVALFASALLLSACGGGDGDPAPTVTASPVSPTPTPEPELAPLTGLPVEDDRVLERPVLAVKIDNATQARPQVGLNAADVVFEEVVEGGSTRFLALFHSRQPEGPAGPVRSGRDVEAELLPPYQPLLVISGAAKPTYEVLRAAGLKIREEGQPEHAFTRDRGRKRPYNLFVDIAAMWQVAADDGLPAAEQSWAFGESTHGETATAVTMSFSPSLRAGWRWQSSEWLREQSGKAHVNAAGEQLSAANVVVLMVPVTAGGGVDAAGSATQHIEVVGEGDAVLLRDGKSVNARWRKPSREAHFELVTDAGARLKLAPGRTWVELLPVGSALQVERPAPPATATASPGGS